MPEIKNTFLQGKMNKDLDERLIPNGQYRDALNVEVSTSEGSDVGTVKNILGNQRVDQLEIGSDFKCVGSIADEKN
jgi:ribosomal 30S subunit maturation factor RimM